MITDEKNHFATTASIQKVLVALCATATILLIWQLVKYSAYGIDFTDEGFYLVWMANPFLYDLSTTQFGFVYHTLYNLLGGNIVALRQANIIITFSCAWILAYYFLSSLATDLHRSRITLLTVSAGLATNAFTIFDSWLPTPSYNSLNFQALLIAATGLILSKKTLHRESIVGWVLFCIGVWLAFMAKPSTALALTVAVFFYLLVARKLSFLIFAFIFVCILTLLFVSAIMIDGTVIDFIKRLFFSAELYGRLGGGHTPSQILRIDKFHLGTKLFFAICFISAALFFALWSMYPQNKKWSFVGLTILIAFFMITTLFTIDQVHWVPGLGNFQGLLIFSVFCTSIISALLLGRLRTLKTIPPQHWAITVLFLLFPHIYAFGTNNNYWQAGCSAAFFWLLAGLPLLSPLIRERGSWLFALPAALVAQAVTATLLQTGLEQPYRQPQALRLNTVALETPPRISGLVLSQGYAEYITSADTAARKADFDRSTPIIDLSGQSPGILYLIGAENLGQAWMVGGYPGSLLLAEAALARTPCEKISAAWILFERSGPRSIPTELMHRLGADFPGSYKRVGTWQTAEGAGGSLDRRTQDLYKPVDQHKTFMVCQKLREESNR